MVAKEQGITLIEVVIYLALFAILFVVVVEFTLAVSERNRNARARTEVERSLIFALEHIEDAFDNAQSIDAGSSIFHSDNGVLVLTVSGEQVMYSLTADTLEYSRTAGSFNLTGPRISVDVFRLEEILDESSAVIGARITLLFSSTEEGVSDQVISAYIL